MEKQAQYEALYRDNKPRNFTQELKDALYAIPVVKELVDQLLTPEEWAAVRIGVWDGIPFYDESNNSIYLPAYYEGKILGTTKGETRQYYENAQAYFKEYTKDIPKEYLDRNIDEYLDDYLDMQKASEISEQEMRMILHEISHYADHLRKGEQFIEETTHYYKDPEKKDIDMEKYLASPAEQQSFLTEIKYMRSLGRDDDYIVRKMIMEYGGKEEYWKEMVSRLERTASLQKKADLIWNIMSADDIHESVRLLDQLVGKRVQDKAGNIWEVVKIVSPYTLQIEVKSIDGDTVRSGAPVQDFIVVPSGVSEKARQWEERWHKRSSLTKKAYTKNVSFEIQPSGDLHIEVLPERLEAVRNYIQSANLTEYEILASIIRWQMDNGWELVTPASIGALTDSPILHAGDYYFWYPDYQIESPLKPLLDGKVIFQGAPSNKVKDQQKEKTREWEERWHKRSQLARYFHVRFNCGYAVVEASNQDRAELWAKDWAESHLVDGRQAQLINVYEVGRSEYDLYRIRVEGDKAKKEIEQREKTRLWEERWHKKSSLTKKAAFWSVWDVQLGQYMATGSDSPTLREAVEDCFEYLISGPEFENMEEPDPEQMTWQEKKKFCEEYEFEFHKHTERMMPSDEALEAEERREEGERAERLKKEEKTRQWEERWHKRSKLSQRSSLTKRGISVGELNDWWSALGFEDIERVSNFVLFGLSEEDTTRVLEEAEQWWDSLSAETMLRHYNELTGEGVTLDVGFHKGDKVKVKPGEYYVSKITAPLEEKDWEIINVGMVFQGMIDTDYGEYTENEPFEKEYGVRVGDEIYLVPESKMELIGSEIAEKTRQWEERWHKRSGLEAIAKKPVKKQPKMKYPYILFSYDPGEMQEDDIEYYKGDGLSDFMEHYDKDEEILEIWEKYKDKPAAQFWKALKNFKTEDYHGKDYALEEAINEWVYEDYNRYSMAWDDEKANFGSEFSGFLKRSKGWYNFIDEDGEIFTASDGDDFIKHFESREGFETLKITQINPTTLEVDYNRRSETVRIIPEQYEDLTYAGDYLGIPGLREGDTEIWFANTIVGPLEIDVDDLKKTHTRLGQIAETNLKKVRRLMQRKVWSPDGEGKQLLEYFEIKHDSLQEGDIIITDSVYYVTKDGFIDLAMQPSGERKMRLEHRRELAAESDDPAILEKLSKDDNVDVRKDVARNVHTPIQVLQALTDDPEEGVRYGVALNGVSTPEILFKLSTDVNPLVRQKVAGHLNTPVQILMNLAKDEVLAVRYAILTERSETSIPSQVLRILMNDPDANVSNKAKQIWGVTRSPVPSEETQKWEERWHKRSSLTKKSDYSEGCECGGEAFPYYYESTGELVLKCEECGQEFESDESQWKTPEEMEKTRQWEERWHKRSNAEEQLVNIQVYTEREIRQWIKEKLKFLFDKANIDENEIEKLEVEIIPGFNKETAERIFGGHSQTNFAYNPGGNKISIPIQLDIISYVANMLGEKKDWFKKCKLLSTAEWLVPANDAECFVRTFVAFYGNEIAHEVGHYISEIIGEDANEELREMKRLQKERGEEVSVPFQAWIESPGEQISIIREMQYLRNKGLSDQDIINSFAKDFNVDESFIENLLSYAISKGLIKTASFKNLTLQTSDVPESLVSQIKEIQKGIDKSILIKDEDERGWIEGGLQKLFHMTILYGVEKRDEEEISEIVKLFTLEGIEAKSGEIEYFDNDKEGKPQTCVVLRIESDELKALHDLLKKEVNNKDSYPTYKAHIAIAYIKYKERLSDIEIKPVTWQVKSIEMSQKDGDLKKVSKLYRKAQAQQEDIDRFLELGYNMAKGTEGTGWMTFDENGIEEVKNKYGEFPDWDSLNNWAEGWTETNQWQYEVGEKINEIADTGGDKWTEEQMYVQMDLKGAWVEGFTNYMAEILSKEREKPSEKARRWEERWHRKSKLSQQAALGPQLWIDPSGKEYPVDPKRGHYGWIFDNKEILKEKEYLDVDEMLRQVEYKEYEYKTGEGLIEILLQAGWIRLSGEGNFEVWDIHDRNSKEIVEDYFIKYPARELYIDYFTPRHDSLRITSEDFTEYGLSEMIDQGIRFKSVYGSDKNMEDIKKIVLEGGGKEPIAVMDYSKVDMGILVFFHDNHESQTTLPLEELSIENVARKVSERDALWKQSDIEEYQRKRDFTETPEPEGTVQENADMMWVLQRHQASKAGLHGDFRLQAEGVLKSFVIRKLDDFLSGKLNRVLVISTEDHPIEYATFEGDIPFGEYGGGHMDIEDAGTYETVVKTDKEWTFWLTSDTGKMEGLFSLILADPTKFGKDKWFLIRKKESKTEKKSELAIM